VLGWEEREQISGALALGMVHAVLESAMDAGEIARQPVDVLARVLLAALHEAVPYVARADDQDAARADVGVIIEGMIDRL
jgi:hypothetical protein